MHRVYSCLAFAVFCSLPDESAQRPTVEKDELAEYRQAGLNGGDPARGKPCSSRTRWAARSAMSSRATSAARGPTWGPSATSMGASNWSSRCWNRRHDPPRLRHDRRDDDGWQGAHGRPAQANRRGTSVARRGGQTRATAARRDRPGAADGHVIDARRAAQDIEGRAVRGPDRLSRDVEATGRRVAVRGHAERDPGGRETDPARAAARGRDAVRPSGLDHRDTGPQGRVPRRRAEGAKDLAHRGGRTRAPEGTVRRLQRRGDRPANSRAWCASRSIRGSSRTASTT